MHKKIPTLPTSEEVRKHICVVPPVRAEVKRPFWSVMIPNFNSAHYLRETLRSVLAQASGPEEMQIEVIDDCSTKDDPQAVVEELGKGRVSFYRHAENQGLTKTFNDCILRAAGHWVHILHSDDMVLPGFYDAYRQIISTTPGLSMVGGKAITINERGHWQKIAGPDPTRDDHVLDDFCSRQAKANLLRFPAVVVSRDAYEKAGGFCDVFRHVNDWDMWFRISQEGGVAGTHRAYALYREHSESDTNRVLVSGENTGEIYLVTLVSLRYLNGGHLSDETIAETREAIARLAEHFAWQLDNNGSTEGRLNQARVRFAMAPGIRSGYFLLKSWIKHRRATAGKSACQGDRRCDKMLEG